ncbi:MAG: hypothetical protein R3Y46_00440 [Opitutales bacterium]
MTKTQKFLIILTSFFVALPSYFLAYAHFCSKLTSWQREQSVDFATGAGSTKFQACVNAITVSGICFVLCAAILLLALKFSKNNEQK